MSASESCALLWKCGALSLTYSDLVADNNIALRTLKRHAMQAQQISLPSVGVADLVFLASFSCEGVSISLPSVGAADAVITPFGLGLLVSISLPSVGAADYTFIRR